MAAKPFGSLAVGAFLVMLLASCEDGQNPFAARSATPDADTDAVQGSPMPAGRTVERDVEAPEAFSSSDQGLWDGRPSLGGIWVAHPDVTEPERVLIRNVANGRETTGALYRREREMPGPRLQVSSDAASALGMLAGAPTDMRVVALRRERIEVAPPAAALATGAVEAAPLDAPTAAAEPAPARSVAAPTAQNRPTARPARAASPAPAAAPSERAPDAVAPSPVPPASAPDAPAAATAPATAPAAQPPAATPSATPPAAALAGGSFVQVGIFSQQSNAESSADTLRQAGMVPTVREQESGDRKVWRVLVGPVATASDRAALLEKIREIGFTDAYVIRN